MSNPHPHSLVPIALTAELAELLLSVVDAENSATKNHLVSAVNSSEANRSHGESVANRSRVRSLAEKSQNLTTIRATIARALRS